jgi:hypothetical protein
MKFRTRKARLLYEIESELKVKNPNSERLLDIFEQYEGDNIDLINKLKKKKRSVLNKINGAIKQSINAHGPITTSNFGSAAKRIYGSLLEEESEDEINYLKIFFINFIIWSVFYSILFSIYLLLF